MAVGTGNTDSDCGSAATGGPPPTGTIETAGFRARGGSIAPRNPAVHLAGGQAGSIFETSWGIEMKGFFM